MVECKKERMNEYIQDGGITVLLARKHFSDILGRGGVHRLDNNHCI